MEYENRFKPGNPGGPGRPPLPDDVKELRKLNKAELEKTLNECLCYTPSQLKKIKDDPESTMLQLFVVSILTHGTNKGDHQRLGFLLDRLIGKVLDRIQVEDPYAHMTLEELKALEKKRIDET